VKEDDVCQHDKAEVQQQRQYGKLQQHPAGSWFATVWERYVSHLLSFLHSNLVLCRA
jgi:hypothetical protein